MSVPLPAGSSDGPAGFPPGRGQGTPAGRVRGRRGRGGPAEAGCYVCGESGHLATECPNRAANAEAAGAPDSEPVPTTLPAGGQLLEVYGDLMTSDDALCHCVSACMAMGKGIAVLFNQRFGRISELKSQNVGVGGVAVLQDGEGSSKRWIYYLVTKPRYYDKPTYETLHASLAQMRRHMEAHNVTRVSMPELGCGLDGLRWAQVRHLLITVFGDMPGVAITVYHFKPAKQMYTRKERFA
jgi:O-acetyl-ADP-ribose deacetylase (regulator of RNase III)